MAMTWSKAARFRVWRWLRHFVWKKFTAFEEREKSSGAVVVVVCFEEGEIQSLQLWIRKFLRFCLCVLFLLLLFFAQVVYLCVSSLCGTLTVSCCL